MWPRPARNNGPRQVPESKPSWGANKPHRSRRFADPLPSKFTAVWPWGRLDVAYSRYLGVVLAGMLLLVAVHAQTPGTAPPAGASQTPGKVPADVAKVERLMAARRDYQRALEQLREYYIQTGDIERAKWAEEELILYHRIQKHCFILDLDVPGTLLKATLNIPDANELAF